MIRLLFKEKKNNSGSSGGHELDKQRVHLGSTVSFMMEVTELSLG